MKSLLAVALATVSLVMAGPSWAQSFPERPVTIIVPFTPGGSTDLMARHVANELQQLWGQSVVVENRPGAGSMIGTAHVAQAAPDGHTILLTTSAFVTAPAVYDELPFDPVKDLRPIGMTGYVAYLIVGSNDLPTNNVLELIELAKAEPMISGSAGLGTTTHFAMEQFMEVTGLDVTLVHFGGGSEAMVGLMSGEIDFYITNGAASLEFIRSGQIQAIAALGQNRLPALPDLASTSEYGLEDLDVIQWLSVFAPAGVSDEVATQLNADINKVIDTDEFRKLVSAIDVIVRPTTLDEFGTQVREELVHWAALAEERGISAN